MFYKKIVVYIPDEQTYKTLRHKLVDDGLTVNGLMLKLIRRYIDSGKDKPVDQKPQPSYQPPSHLTETDKQTEAQVREREAQAFGNPIPEPEPIDIRDGQPPVKPFVPPDEPSNSDEKGHKYVWTLEGFRERFTGNLVPPEDYEALQLVPPE